MSRHVRLREFLLGVEGIALLRHLFTGSDEAAHRRTDEIRRIASETEDERFGLGIDVPALDVTAGYARWSTTYDEPGNPLVSVEQPIVWSLLDAASSRPRARRGVRDRIPPRYLVLCALALDHSENVERPLSEFARVVAPGGRVIISDIHPTLSAIGGAAFFRDAGGASGFVRGHRHSHASYLDAFAATGLELRKCIEGRFGEAETKMQQPAAAIVPEATEAAYLELPAVVVWDLFRPAGI